MESVIKHILNVGLGKIKSNKKGNQLKSIVVNEKKHIETTKNNHLQKH